MEKIVQCVSTFQKEHVYAWWNCIFWGKSIKKGWVRPSLKNCTFFSNLSPLWCLLFSHDVIFVTKRESQTLSTHTKWDTTKTATFLLFCTIQRFKAETFKLLDWHTIKLWPCCFFLWKKLNINVTYDMTWWKVRMTSCVTKTCWNTYW